MYNALSDPQWWTTAGYCTIGIIIFCITVVASIWFGGCGIVKLYTLITGWFNKMDLKLNHTRYQAMAMEQVKAELYVARMKLDAEELKEEARRAVRLERQMKEKKSEILPIGMPVEQRNAFVAAMKQYGITDPNVQEKVLKELQGKD